ncbi:hypothetical protein MOKP76_47400 [Mycobacterium avium subsp. hominissuis]
MRPRRGGLTRPGSLMLTVDPDRDVGLTVVSAAAGRMHVSANGFRIYTVPAVAIEDAVGS